MAEQPDLILRHGSVYDGSGGPPRTADVAISGDRIVAVEELRDARGAREIDASGLAVAPGFVNMLSWAMEGLIEDGRSQSNIRQGVTLEVFGEAGIGPLTPEMKKEVLARQGDIKYPVEWDSLGGFMSWLAARGVSTNIGSFVSFDTVRINVLGYADRAPSTADLDRMRALVGVAMEEGALGLATALIYAPSTYAETGEIAALAKAAAEHGGMYISHMRSESDRLLEAIEELIGIARHAGCGAEIYHLKAAGQRNWPKMQAAFEKIEAARAWGLRITADHYGYPAGSTGLNATMPAWVQEGGHNAWVARLKQPEIRQRVAAEMRKPGPDWENYLVDATPDGILLAHFKNPDLKALTGKKLSEVARMRGTSPEEAAMDLVIEDNSRVTSVFFIMSEDNVRETLSKPWVHFGSDAGSQAPEGVFLRSSTHPRAYGFVAQLLGKWVRQEQLISLPEAIQRLSAQPAEMLKLKGRGRLAEGFYADVVAFDAGTIIDHATYQKPLQYATGMRHVLVNGVQVLEDGAHTGAKPGRFLRGPGWKQSA